MIPDWIVWRVPFLRARREREIKAWADYAVASMEAAASALPSEELRQAFRTAWVARQLRRISEDV